MESVISCFQINRQINSYIVDMSASKPNQSHHSPNPTIIYEVRNARWIIDVYTIRQKFEFYNQPEWFELAYLQAIKEAWHNSNRIALRLKKYSTFGKRMQYIQRYVTNAYDNRTVQSITHNTLHKNFFVIFASTPNNTNQTDEVDNYYIVYINNQDSDDEFVQYVNTYLVTQRHIENNMHRIFQRELPPDIHKLIKKMSGRGRIGHRTRKNK